jgi:maltose alpha-D-glucosyltransferase/alpha-amylase
LGDFVEFTRACHQRGIRVMMDLVVNHCSDQHPWFQTAIADPTSKYRDYFIWADKKPDDAHEGVIFPGVQETTWTHSKKAKAYYFHRFFEFQPDLNMANPQVQEEVLKIVGFWLELGISGFRIDAVPFLIAEEGINVNDPKPAYELLRRIREFAQWRRGDAVLLAEANIPAEEAKNYFGEDGDRLHMIFNFPVNQALFYALATADTKPLRKALEESHVAGRSDTAQWANFLRNHDELDIGRLPDDQKQAVFDAFGPDEDMQLYDRGIRRRLAPMLNGDNRRMELATSLMMTLPGTPVLRYGDEIGMGDDLSLPERDAARTAMQWSNEKNAGFSAGDKNVHALISDGPFSYCEVNVAKQRTDQNSLLNWTERTIRLRKEVPEVGWGDFIVFDTDPEILAMRYDWHESGTVFVHNLSDTRMECLLDVKNGDPHSREMVCLQTDVRSIPDEDGRHRLLLEPYGYYWYRLGGMDTLATHTGGENK